jgi:hypothetical protein
MADAEVSMDFEVVEDMSDAFRTSADVLQEMDARLETIANRMKESSCYGLIGDAILQHYIDLLKPRIVEMASTCDELTVDLRGAIASLRDSDSSGSQRFTA